VSRRLLTIAEEDRERERISRDSNRSRAKDIQSRIAELERYCQAWAESDARLKGLIAERDDRIAELKAERDALRFTIARLDGMVGYMLADINHSRVLERNVPTREMLRNHVDAIDCVIHDALGDKR
jgi:chromosome segregation ATPase